MWRLWLVVLVLWSAAAPAVALHVAVLGGTGFIGKEIVAKLVSRGHRVTSLSRRGGTSTSTVTHVKGDGAELATCLALGAEHGPFDAAVHCIGLLLDSESKLSGLNKIASGSGSTPDEGSTYDRVTRVTAFNLIEMLSQQSRPLSAKPTPFLFVSAAEAAWTFRAPVDFLERYLVAKRAVERRLQETKSIRHTILRPSLVYTASRPAAFLSVVPFFVGNAVGLPFVDKPVTVDVLSAAAVVALEQDGVSGFCGFREIELLARKFER